MAGSAKEKVFHQKLIRDKIPQIIEANGGQCEVGILDKKKFKRELIKKLFEELDELETAKKEDRVKEAADALEVLKTIAGFYGIVDFRLVEEEQVKRREERGGFEKRLFLVWSSAQSGK